MPANLRSRAPTPVVLSAPVHFLFTLALTGLIASGEGPRIEWDEQTLTLVEPHAVYGRMIRLQNGRILCCYDRGGKVWCKISGDEGKTWESPVLVAEYAFGVATNPEILQLRSGEILCFYNERPNDGRHPFAIVLASSSDDGGSWSVPRRLYEADTRFENGCWEPAAIELPDGEVQLFFANESPYRASAEQEISMLRSRDGAESWSAASSVSFRSGHRDGMPVPLVLDDGRGIVVAIEDNGLHGKFKPVIIYSPLKNSWHGRHVDGSSPRRWPALKTPLPAYVSASAPYIRRMPTGETVLSVQITEGLRLKPHMVVYMGDDWARSFAGKSVPFQVPFYTACLWNSLFIKDETTVTAISGTTIDGVAGLWAIDGRVKRDGTPPPPTEPSARVVSIWRHRVDDCPPQIHRFYSNGKINSPDGPAAWLMRDSSLTLRWPSTQAPGGAWVDRCVLADDGQTYTGMNQNGNRITGELSQIRE